MRLSNGIPVAPMGAVVPQHCPYHILLQASHPQPVALLNWHEHERKHQFSDSTVLLSHGPLKEQEGRLSSEAKNKHFLLNQKKEELFLASKVKR